MTVTEPAPLSDLVERVGRLTGPDREVDALVALALGENPPRSKYAPNFPKPATFITGAYSHWEAPAYTASVDAVLALVERKMPGSWVRIETGDGREYHHAYIETAADDSDEFEGTNAASGALALLKALLLALTTQEP